MRAQLDTKGVNIVALDTLAPQPEAEDYPYPKEVLGEISGVRFPPARPEVRLVLSDGSELQVVATGSQVDQALVLRGKPVVARVMTGSRGEQRLLSLRHADNERPPVLTAEEAGAWVLDRWRETLERLGQ
jgi:hypothetical protein